MMLNAKDADTLAQGVNEQNAARTRRAEAAVNVLLAVVLAVLGAVGLVHWASQCNVMLDGAALCMAAVIPTRPGLLQRAWRRVYMQARAAYLRTLLRACEQDISYHQETAELAPQLEALARLRADELRVQLVDCELATRAR